MVFEGNAEVSVLYLYSVDRALERKNLMTNARLTFVNDTRTFVRSSSPVAAAQ
jgi:hypothetical protein